MSYAHPAARVMNARPRRTGILLPTIHPAGSLRNVLRQHHTAARQSVDAAMQALNRTYPEERDYYPQGRAAYQQAVIEHEARTTRLKAVYDELAELVAHIK